MPCCKFTGDATASRSRRLMPKSRLVEVALTGNDADLSQTRFSDHWMDREWLGDQLTSKC